MRALTILTIILVIIFGGVGLFFAKYSVDNVVENIVSDGVDDIEKITACMGFDCSAGTIYIGSINSDKYYECKCSWGKSINEENLVCFSSDAVAVNAGRIKSEC